MVYTIKELADKKSALDKAISEAKEKIKIIKSSQVELQVKVEKALVSGDIKTYSDSVAEIAKNESEISALESFINSDKSKRSKYYFSNEDVSDSWNQLQESYRKKALKQIENVNTAKAKFLAELVKLGEIRKEASDAKTMFIEYSENPICLKSLGGDTIAHFRININNEHLSDEQKNLISLAGYDGI